MNGIIIFNNIISHNITLKQSRALLKIFIMNQVHIHLLITHLPVFGSLMGALVLAHGIWTKSNQTKIAAYNLFILSALGATIAYVTGEGAEETVENLPGIIENSIKQHEEFAMFALISFILLGLIAIIGIIITLRKSMVTRSVAIIILIVSIISFLLVAQTSSLGGKIRHTEINALPNTDALQQDKEIDND
jgi:uncharacterized membrane protein